LRGSISINSPPADAIKFLDHNHMLMRFVENVPDWLQKNDVNKSEEIRQLLRANPKMPVKEILSTLAGQGIKV
jgi:hypothetical protein